jgi:DNA-binding PadR family transcriptional regulator
MTLKTNDVYILFTLLEGPLHGYRIAQQIEEMTGGAVRLEAGNLHRTVQKLIRGGFVRVSDDRPPRDKDDPRRRYYALTDRGQHALGEETARLRTLVDSLEAHGVGEGSR